MTDSRSTDIQIDLRHLEGIIGLPAPPQYHVLSVSELEELGAMGRNPQLDVFWGLLGVILGTVIPAVQAFIKIAEGTALAATDALFLVAFVACLSAAIALAATGFGRKSRHDRLLDEIRARPTVPLTAIVRLDYPQS